MSPFTNEDLRHLKEEASEEFYSYAFGQDELLALLARLELAETAIQKAYLYILSGTAGGDIHWESFKDAYEVWYKVTGE